MNMPSRPSFVDQQPPNSNAQETRDPTLLIAQDPTRKRQGNFFSWWFRLTAPKELPDNAPLADRERARRGQLISTVLFFASILFLLGTVVGVLGPLHAIAVATGALLLLVLISSQLNRTGYTNLAGLLIPIGLNIALIVVIFSTPLSPASVQLYDLLVFVEVFAASFLTPNGWVLALFAIFNIAFIQFDITLQPHTAAFTALLATDGVATRIRPVIIHIVITGVIWLWVRSASQAIARADRAEVIANLEHIVAEQERSVAQEKRQLDESVQAIVETHISVANGNLSSRVPLSSGNVLWKIAGPLNNLLARYQHMQQELQESKRSEQELWHTKEALTQLVYFIRSAKAGRRVPPPPRTGTVADGVLQEIDSLLPHNDSSPNSTSRRLP
jgi:hypothetical protein